MNSPTAAIRRLFNGRQPWVYHHITFDGGNVSDEWLHAHSAELNQLTILTLRFRNTRVTGDGLAAIRGPLFSLSLNGTPLTDADVANLPSTGCLHIAHTGISSSALSELARRRSLYFISIDATQATPDGVSSLASSPRLSDVTVVDADDTTVAQVSRLQGLRSLTLFSRGITDASLPSLKQIREVQWLTLFDSKLSENQIQELQQALSGCIVFQKDSEEWGYSRAVVRE